MGEPTSKRSVVGVLVISTLVAGCAWDNSPPPYHSVISYDPSRAQTYVSTAETANSPSTSDWKTNQVVGTGYGATTGASPSTTGGAVGGAVSSPSGVSYGGAAGTGSPAPAAPGTTVGSPSTTSPAINPPQPATGFNPTLSSPGITLQSPTGFTNTTSGVLFTNHYTAPTNTLPNPSLNIPRP